MTPGQLTCEIPRRPSWSAIYTGLGINASAVLLLVALDPHLRTSVLPETAVNSRYVTLVAPITKPQPVVTAPATMEKVARVERPQVVPPLQSRMEPPKPKEVAKDHRENDEMKAAEAATVTAPNTPMPIAPARKVTTNVFDSEASDLPVVHESARKVQTGGFGDPNGLAGQGDPKRETLTAMNVGSFDLPAGPGKGHGTGVLRGTSGVIRTAGFGDTSAERAMAARNENLGSSGFGNVVVQTRARDAQPEVVKSQVQPVQILFKPRPAYTPEAQRLGVQGEVLIDVVFEASGALHINRVVKGLGYGLDDMALDAAKKIQFRPALRDGQPYDYAALVHIRFELAD